MEDFIVPILIGGIGYIIYNWLFKDRSNKERSIVKTFLEQWEKKEQQPKPIPIDTKPSLYKQKSVKEIGDMAEELSEQDEIEPVVVPFDSYRSAKQLNKRAIGQQKKKLQEGIVMREVLGPPRAKNPYRFNRFH